MTVSTSMWLTAGVGFVYATISYLQFKANNIAMGITYAGYAFSNVGLMMALR